MNRLFCRRSGHRCAAFMHQDGEGYNVVLQVLPLNGKVVLRSPKAQAEQAQDEPQAGKRRGSNTY